LPVKTAISQRHRTTFGTMSTGAISQVLALEPG
jgi:hypothetical protein